MINVPHIRPSFVTLTEVLKVHEKNVFYLDGIIPSMVVPRARWSVTWTMQAARRSHHIQLRVAAVVILALRQEPLGRGRAGRGARRRRAAPAALRGRPLGPGAPPLGRRRRLRLRGHGPGPHGLGLLPRLRLPVGLPLGRGGGGRGGRGALEGVLTAAAQGGTRRGVVQHPRQHERHPLHQGGVEGGTGLRHTCARGPQHQIYGAGRDDYDYASASSDRRYLLGGLPRARAARWAPCRTSPLAAAGAAPASGATSARGARSGLASNSQHPPIPPTWESCCFGPRNTTKPWLDAAQPHLIDRFVHFTGEIFHLGEVKWARFANLIELRLDSCDVWLAQSGYSRE